MNHFQFDSPNYTQTPNDLFDHLLKEIDDLSELKVTLAAVRMTIGYHRDAAELSQEYLMKMTGLSRNSVRRGLALSIQRGTLYIVRPSTNKTGGVYSLNVRGSADDSPEGQPVTPLKITINKKTSPAAANWKEPITSNPPNENNVYKTWESVGLNLSPFISEALFEFEQDYSAAWVCEAIKRAAKANKRNLNYVRGILERWQAKGVMDEPSRTEKNVPVVIEIPEYQKNIRWQT